MITLDTVAEFTWDYGNKFLLETDEGNFEWSDPDYNGDNTIVKFNGTYRDWLASAGIPYGRMKGSHTIRDYCGDQVKIV